LRRRAAKRRSSTHAGKAPTRAATTRTYCTASTRLYVKAYRDADVAWYVAHLAPDYVVTNGDGLFSDRGSALIALHARASPLTSARSRSAA